MIIRTAFRFYAPRLSYTISRILKSVPTWGWITNHSGLMKSEWELDADVLSRVGRAKWGVNPHATNNQSRIKMAVNCLPSLGPSAPSPDRSVSCGKHGARGRSSLGLGMSGFQNLDKRYQSINQQIQRPPTDYLWCYLMFTLIWCWSANTNAIFKTGIKRRCQNNKQTNCICTEREVSFI